MHQHIIYWIVSYAGLSELAVQFVWHMSLYNIPSRTGIHTKRTATNRRYELRNIPPISASLDNFYVISYCNQKMLWGMLIRLFLYPNGHISDCSWSLELLRCSCATGMFTSSINFRNCIFYGVHTNAACKNSVRTPYIASGFGGIRGVPRPRQMENNELTN